MVATPRVGRRHGSHKRHGRSELTAWNSVVNIEHVSWCRCAGLVTLIEWPFLPEIRTPADDKDWPWPLVRPDLGLKASMHPR